MIVSGSIAKAPSAAKANLKSSLFDDDDDPLA
jgi:hypothetical protein